MDKLEFLSASQLAEAIRNKKISSVELLHLYQARFKKWNPEINAIVTTDFDSAEQRAKKADEALAKGEIWGPLHGLPVTVKDSVEVIGMPCTSD